MLEILSQCFAFDENTLSLLVKLLSSSRIKQLSQLGSSGYFLSSLIFRVVQSVSFFFFFFFPFFSFSFLFFLIFFFKLDEIESAVNWRRPIDVLAAHCGECVASFRTCYPQNQPHGAFGKVRSRSVPCVFIFKLTCSDSCLMRLSESEDCNWATLT